MGTNYYWESAPCACCGHVRRLHIGKKSGGWRFIFNVHPAHGLTTVASWRERLEKTKDGDGRILDEYDKMVTWDYFQHSLEPTGEVSQPRSYVGEYLDEGYLFCNEEVDQYW